MKQIKKIACLILTVLMLAGCSACTKKDKDDDNLISDGGSSVSAKYKDGEYKATDGKYDDQGYKSTVEVVVKDGKVYSVDCDAENKDDGTKKAHSESGKYNMKTAGAQYDWHEEIAFFERHVVEKGLESIKTDSYGKTDSITGCTIAVDGYIKLINKALEKAKE